MSADSPQPQGDPLIGRVICGCEILTLICRGGMGRLYRARQRSLDRIVAVKVLSPALGSNEEFLGRFRREARALANLLHPNVVAIHDFGEEGDVRAIVMEYVEGENVGSMAAKAASLPVTRAINIIRQVAEGLAYAHERNIIHCDLKPENILVTTAGVAKLADFGLAKSVRGESGITRDGVVLGTPTYMSPEQCSSGKLDARTDIYSLGTTFYRMVAGRDAFEGEDAFAVMLKHQNEPPADPRRYNPNIPSAVVKIILRMMEKPRENRYQTAADVVRVLLPLDKEAGSRGRADQTVEYPHRDFAVAREAIEAGFITPAQLRHCIERQEAEAGAAPDLPELFIEEGIVTEQQVQQMTDRTHARDEARADEEFARLVVEAGLATKDQIAECLRQQRSLVPSDARTKLARVLGASGILKPPQVAEVLLRQLKEAQRAEDAELLELVRRDGALRDEEIGRCLAEQRRQETQGRIHVLRQTVLDLGLLPSSQLREMLRKKMRQDLLQYVADRERAKSAPVEAIMPRGMDIQLEEEEPCPVCKQRVAVSGGACPHCGASLEEARRQAALRGGARAARPAAARPAARTGGKAAGQEPIVEVQPERTPPKPGEEWEIRLPSGEPSKPLSFPALVKLVREKRVQPGTILRGPLTLGVWRQARFTPKLCRLFGTCHYCGAKLPPESVVCAACQTHADRPHTE